MNNTQITESLSLFTTTRQSASVSSQQHHRRSRNERDNQVDSPEISLKQQRINTAKKSKPIATINTENLKPSSGVTSSSSFTKSLTKHEQHIGVLDQNITISTISSQERQLLQYAKIVCNSQSIDDLIPSETASSPSLGLPLTCNPYERHFLQNALTLSHTMENSLALMTPLVPSRGDFSTLHFFYKFIWILTNNYDNNMCVNFRVDSVNSVLYESDPQISSSLSYNINAVFEKFATCHNLRDSVDSKVKVSIAQMNQIELGVMLMYFSQALNPSEFFLSKKTGTLLSTSISNTDVVINALLVSLNDKKKKENKDKEKDAREMSMTVSVLAFLVQHHSLAATLLSPSNACQLVKGLLTAVVHPQESSELSSSMLKSDSSASTTSSASENASGVTENTTSSSSSSRRGRSISSFRFLPAEWEVSSSRMGLRKLLSLELVTRHSTVRRELNSFVLKWWTRLEQAAQGKGPLVLLVPGPPKPPPSASVTLPSQFAAALQRSAPATVSVHTPAVKYGLDSLTDIFSLTGGQNAHEEELPRKQPVSPPELPKLSSVEVKKFIQKVISPPTAPVPPSSGKKQPSDGSDVVLLPTLEIIRTSFLAPSELDSSPHFLVHFIASSSDPRTAMSATELASAILNILKDLAEHPALMEALQQERVSELSPLRPVEDLQHQLSLAATRFARDLFQHTMIAMPNSQHATADSFSEHESEASEEGPFRKILSLEERRRPLAEMSLSLQNMSTSPPSYRAAVISKHEEDSLAFLRLLWEPVLLARIRLMRECTYFASLRPIHMKADVSGASSLSIVPYSSLEAQRQEVVSGWILEAVCNGSSEDSPEGSPLHQQQLGLRRRVWSSHQGNRSASLEGGEKTLAGTCRSLAQSIQDVRRRENSNTTANASMTTGEYSTGQVLQRFSGALVDVMDIISCLVLGPGREAATSATDKSNRQTSTTSSEEMQSSRSTSSVSVALSVALSSTFKTYSESISYAIETCSTLTRSAVQRVTGPAGETVEKCNTQQQEQSSLLKMIDTVHEDARLASGGSDENDVTGTTTPARTQDGNDEEFDKSFSFPLDRDEDDETSLRPTDLVDSGRSVTSTPSPVVQRRLAYNSSSRSTPSGSEELQQNTQNVEHETESDGSITDTDEVKRLSDLHLHPYDDDRDSEGGGEGGQRMQEEELDESIDLLASPVNHSSKHVTASFEKEDRLISPVLVRRPSPSGTPFSGTPLLSRTIIATPTQQSQRHVEDLHTAQYIEEDRELKYERRGGGGDSIDMSVSGGVELHTSTVSPVTQTQTQGTQVATSRCSVQSSSGAHELQNLNVISSRGFRNSASLSLSSRSHSITSSVLQPLPSQPLPHSNPQTGLHTNVISSSSPASGGTGVKSGCSSFNFEPRSDADVKRLQDNTHLRMELISVSLELEERNKLLLMTKSSLEDAERSKQHWQWQAEDGERKRVMDQTRISSIHEANEKLTLEMSEMKSKYVNLDLENKEQAKKMSSLESLLEDAWTKIKALTQLEETSRVVKVKATEEANMYRDTYLASDRKCTLALADAAACQKEVTLLTQQLETERESHKILSSEAQKSKETLIEFRRKEKTLTSQLEGVMVELEDVRERYRQSLETADQLQGVIQSQRSDILALQSKCEAEKSVCRQLQQEITDHLTDKQIQKKDFLNKIDSLEEQLSRQVEQHRSEKRKFQDVLTELETENSLLQNIISAEKASYTRLEAEHHNQITLSDSLSSELTAQQMAAEALRVALNEKVAEINATKGELSKHRELISYINKISNETDKAMVFAK